METYGHDFARLKQSFVDFLQHLPFYGVAVLCDDDKHVRSIMPLVSKQIVRYGFSESANVRAENIHAEEGRMVFDVVRVNGTTSRLSVGHPQSARPPQRAERPRGDRRGYRGGRLRRSHRQGAGRIQGRRAPLPALRRGGACPLAAPPPSSTTTVITRSRWRPPSPPPAAPSPTSAWCWPFQPHRFTRTRDCFEDFVKVLVHRRCAAAGRGLCRRRSRRSWQPTAVRWPGRCVWQARSSRSSSSTSRRCRRRSSSAAKDGDVVITMGAGSIGARAGQAGQWRDLR
jgi:UDP-N-acetylmuramate--alanine ligase